MSNSQRRSGFVRDHRVALVAVGALTVVAGITFFPQASNAAQSVPTVNCPDVSGRLAGVAVPASARAEVDRELALLNKQIDNANRRIASSVGQGGPNFIQNAVLGPLSGKRTAVLDRISIAIGRRGTAPQGLEALAACTLNNAGGQGGANPLNGNRNNQNNNFRNRNNQNNQNQGNQNQGNQDNQNQGNQNNQNQGNQNNQNQGNQNNQNQGNQNQGNNQRSTADLADDTPLSNNCQGSRLQPHDGFQNGNRCVSTQFGELADEGNNPTLLITSAPRQVQANQAFELRVSTRNLVRDRFLPAAQGGYYKERAFLTADGIARGHFHTACRRLNNTSVAPDPAPVPEFFVATEDGGGGRNPDQVTIRVSGLPRGEAQCTVWAGDGSHRVPMMQRANQIPAVDSVRISVR
jgi:hypothetical protein